MDSGHEDAPSQEQKRDQRPSVMYQPSFIHREVTTVSLVSESEKRDGVFCDVMLRGDIVAQLPKKGDRNGMREIFFSGLQVVDEDGVECFSSRFEFMCRIAQAAGFDFADLNDLEILAPRSTKPLSSPKERWDRLNRFAVVGSDKQFQSLLMRWIRYESKQARIKELTSRAFDDLQAKLTQKDSSRVAKYETARAGAHGVWKLALNPENHEQLVEKNILPTILQLLNDYGVADAAPSGAVASSAAPTTMSPYARRKSLDASPASLSDLCTHLAGAFWAIVSIEYVRKQLTPTMIAQACETAMKVLHTPPTTTHPNLPSTAGCTKLTSHSTATYRKYTLSALRCLLSEASCQRFLYDSRWLQDNKPKSANLLQASENFDVDVLLYMSTAVRWTRSRTIQRHLASILSRILSESEVIQYFTSTPSKRMEKVVQNLTGLLHSTDDEDSRKLGLAPPAAPDISVRLCAVTLLSKFAYFSKKARSWLLASQSVVDGTVETVQWASRLVFAEAWDDLKEESDEMDAPKRPLVTIFESILKGWDGSASPTAATTYEDYDDFADEEWPLTRDRALDCILLNSTGILWGIAQALVEAETEPTFAQAQGQVLPEFRTNAVRTLIALILCARDTHDPRPAVELVATSALNVLANSPILSCQIIECIPAFGGCADASQLAEKLLVEKLRERSKGSKEELLRTFRQLDTSGVEPLLDFVEFQRAFSKLKLSGFSKEDLRRMFEKYDDDGSGTISPSEFVNGVEASWEDLLNTPSDFPVVLGDALLGSTKLGETFLANFKSDESEMCALRALCGVLRAIVAKRMTSFCVLPELDVDALCGYLNEFEDAEEKPKNSLLRKRLASTALMLYCQVANADVDCSQNNAAMKAATLLWTEARLETMLKIARSLVRAVTSNFTPPDHASGSRKTKAGKERYASSLKTHIELMGTRRLLLSPVIMGLWSLARHDTMRATLFSVKGISVFSSLIQMFTRWFSEERRRHVHPKLTVLKTLRCLNIVLKPLLLLLRDRGRVSLDASRSPVEKCIALLVNVVCKTVLPFCEDLGRSSEIPSSGLSTRRDNRENEQACLNEIGGKCLDAIWNLAEQGTFDHIIFTDASLTTIRDMSTNAMIFPALRQKASCILYSLYFADRSDSSDAGAGTKTIMKSALGSHFLERIVLSFLMDAQEQLRSFGASFLSSLRPSKLGHEIIREGGGVGKMIDLACYGTQDNAQRNALQGLLYATCDAENQDYVGKRGLYKLLKLAWTVASPELQILLGQVMNNLTKNPKNRTRIYKAELRCKQMIGWKNAEAAENELELSARLEDHGAGASAHPVRTGDLASPRRARTESIEEKLNKVTFKGPDASVKQDYMRWLDAIEGAPEPKPARPSKPSSKPSKMQKRSPRSKFIVKSPAQSPLWEFKHHILDTKGDDGSIPPLSKLNELKETVASAPHASHTAFSELEYRAANLKLGIRLQQPARGLWEAVPVDAAESRWSPRVEKVTQSPALDDAETVVKMVDGKGKVFVFNKDINSFSEDLLMDAASDGHLCMFGHVEGAQLYKQMGMPLFEFPGGKKVYLYHTGQLLSTFSDPNGGGKNLITVHGQKDPEKLGDCGLPADGDGLPTTPNFAFVDSWLKRIMGARPQAIAPVPPPPVDLPDAATKREGSAGKKLDPEITTAGIVTKHLSKADPHLTMSKWTDGGYMQDEPIPFIVQSTSLARREEARRRRQQRQDAQNAGSAYGSNVHEDSSAPAAPWSFKKSMAKSRTTNKIVGERKPFWNDDNETPLALEADWRICEQKRAFRKLLSRWQSSVEAVKGILRENYRMLCDVFKFYSCIEPVQEDYLLSRNEFTDFVNDSGIRAETMQSMVNEGQLDTYYIQVSTPFEKPTKQQKLFMEECTIMNRKRGHALMRYEFMELIVRLAEAKYLKTQEGTKASCMEEALHMLLDNNVKRLYNSEIAINRAKFREIRMHNEDVDEVMRENLRFLKRMFASFAGVSADTELCGGVSGKRMSPREWIMLMASIGAFSPYFGYRDSLMIFKLSTMDVIDEVVDWRMSVSLTFLGFLEAIARTADVMLIPTAEQLELVGADDICAFYRILESTCLWNVVASKAQEKGSIVHLNCWMNHGKKKNTFQGSHLRHWGSSEMKIDQGHLPFDSRPLANKLEMLLELLQDMKARHERQMAVRDSWSSGDHVDVEAKQQSHAKSSAKFQNTVAFLSKNDRHGSARSVVDDAVARSDTKAFRESANEFETSVASKLHDAWRESRGKEADGTFVPRQKILQGKAYDIANLSFSELPPYFKLENLLAAHVACECIRDAYVQHSGDKDALKSYLRSSEFLEFGGEKQHIYWLKRNGKKDWVTEEQRLPYEELSDEEKEKDREIVRVAVETYVLKMI